ncbi:MAG: hypothetical protein HDR01_09765 [Lachnospiraceae bacterium]|nr:hypothetical protein [Lachnospiraceae bacterium]
MKKTKVYIKKAVSLLLTLSLIITLWGAMRTDVYAATANKYGTYTGSKPSKYNYTGNTIHILPKKVFYAKSTGKLYYYAYVYNNTDKTIYGMKNLKITVKTSANKTIASKTFYSGKRRNMTINPGSYKTICYVFEKKYIKNKKFYFGTAKKLKTQAEFVYYT